MDPVAHAIPIDFKLHCEAVAGFLHTLAQQKGVILSFESTWSLDSYNVLAVQCNTRTAAGLL